MSEIDTELAAYHRVREDLLGDAPTDASLLASAIVFHFIRLAHHIEHRLEFEIHRPMGWTWAGFRIMFNLYVLDSAEPAQLADILRIARPSVTSNLDKLERDGYLTRTRRPENGTRVEVVLTAKGKRAVQRATPRHNLVEQELMAGLDAQDQSQLADTLQALYRSLLALDEP